MKELYLNPEMDVVKFSIEDVISTSNGELPEATTTSEFMAGGENEGEKVSGGWG